MSLACPLNMFPREETCSVRSMDAPCRKQVNECLDADLAAKLPNARTTIGRVKSMYGFYITSTTDVSTILKSKENDYMQSCVCFK